VKLRGYLTIAVWGAGLIALDPVQRTVVPGLALPGRRIAILGWWERLLAYFVINTARWIAGACIPPPPTVPGHGGVLVLMNYQSGSTSRWWSCRCARITRSMSRGHAMRVASR